MTVLLERIDDVRWLLPRSYKASMLVPGRIYGDETIVAALREDLSLEQVANVASLPGIVGYSLAMPDVHQGYGFPIGAVAAFDTKEGIISPGGVGYDISCGVRLMVSTLEVDDLKGRCEDLARALFHAVPSGVGSRSSLRLSGEELRRVLEKGARWAVDRGLGEAADLARIEEGGTVGEADGGALSHRALERGLDQLGTLGSGNHFIEVQVVDAVYDVTRAATFGLSPGRVAVMIHCGSRGLGHQVCDDGIRLMARMKGSRVVAVPDRQLCCAPLGSTEAEAYLAAMRSAANYALANREVIGHQVRSVFCAFGSRGLRLLYDVSHNIAHVERHRVDGVLRRLCVHRKGATRALPPGHGSLSPELRPLGQPVLVPGSMGTASYVLVGTESGAEEAFASTCHGAGRQLSRQAAKKATIGQNLTRRLAGEGIVVCAEREGTLREEAPEAYKDIDAVVDVVERSGISAKVARLRPLAVIKG